MSLGLTIDIISHVRLCFDIIASHCRYEHWLGFDWFAASNGIVGGNTNAWVLKSGIDNATLRSVQDEVGVVAPPQLALKRAARLSLLSAIIIIIIIIIIDNDNKYYYYYYYY